MNFNLFENILIKNIETIKYTIPKETGSLLELLDLPSSQSIVIKIGNIIEKSINEFIENFNRVTNLKNIHGDMINFRQIDTLFKYKKKVYYFEIKSNMNMDTEKSLQCKHKIEIVNTFLKKHYKNCDVISKFLSVRYPNAEEVKHFKKPIEKQMIYGYADFFKLFNIKVNNKMWENMFKKIQAILDINMNNEEKVVKIEKKDEKDNEEEENEEKIVKVEKERNSINYEYKYLSLLRRVHNYEHRFYNDSNKRIRRI